MSSVSVHVSLCLSLSLFVYSCPLVLRQWLRPVDSGSAGTGSNGFTGVEFAGGTGGVAHFESTLTAHDSEQM